MAVLAGAATANVGAAIALTQLLTPAGTELLASWDTQCFDVDFAVAGPYVTGDPSTVEPFATLLAANTAGTVVTPTPLLLFHGDADTTVLIAYNDTLSWLCATGQVVERRVVAGASHATTIAQARPRRLGVAHWARRRDDLTDLHVRHERAPMIKRSMLGAAAAVLSAAPLVIAAGPTSTTAAPAPGPVEFAMGDQAFFAAQSNPGGEHGDLVRWQAIEASFGQSYRIMYLSQTVAGAPTVVTGLVSVSDAPPPSAASRCPSMGTGRPGWPTRARHRSSSRTSPPTLPTAPSSSRSATAPTTDGPPATDYEGLGGPGSHPMLVGVSEGRSMLDAGRAARQIPGVYVDTTAITGFSQGGHAALWRPNSPPNGRPNSRSSGRSSVLRRAIQRRWRPGPRPSPSAALPASDLSPGWPSPTLKHRRTSPLCSHRRESSWCRRGTRTASTNRSPCRPPGRSSQRIQPPSSRSPRCSSPTPPAPERHRHPC